MSTGLGFQDLYPDVDPRTPVPTSLGEACAHGVALAVTVFGAVAQLPQIFGAGLVFCALATVIQSQQPARRLRAMARYRFPTAGWVTYSPRWPLVVWAAVTISSGLTMWFSPADRVMPVAAVTAGVSGIALSCALYFPRRPH